MANNVVATATVNINANASPIPAAILKQVNAVQRQLNSKPLNISINTKGLNTSLGTLSKLPLGRISRDADRFGDSMTAATQRVVAFGASVGAIYAMQSAIVDLIKTTINVEKQFKEIEVLTASSTKNFKEFEKGIFSAAKTTATSFNNAAIAAQEFSRQGLGLEKTLERTKDALILSKLGGLELEKAVESLTATMNTFGKEVFNTREIVDKFARVDAKFAVSTKDLAEGLSRVGNSAQEAGASFNETIAAITALQQRTARGGSVIGNSLKSIFTRIQRSDTLDAIEGLGVAVKDVEGNTRPALKILSDLAERFKTVGDAQKKQLAEQIAGVYQINQFLALINDLGSSYSIVAAASNEAANAQGDSIKRIAELTKTTDALVKQSITNITQFSSALGNVTFDKFLKNILNATTASGGFIEILTETIGKIDSQDGETAGSKFAETILKGFANFFSGPGLALGLKLITGFTFKIFKDLGGITANVLGINKSLKDQKFLQDAINLAIQTSNGGYKERIALATTIEQKEKIILELLKAQKLASSTIDPAIKSLYGQGVRISGTGKINTGRASSGFIPAIKSESRAIKTSPDYSGSRNATPKIIPNFTMGGVKQPVVVNSAEKIVPTNKIIPNYAGPDKMSILNPRQQKVLGFDGGFVPNFAISLSAIKNAVKTAKDGGVEFTRSGPQASYSENAYQYDGAGGLRIRKSPIKSINIPKGTSSEIILHEIGHFLAGIGMNNNTILEDESMANKSAYSFLSKHGKPSDMKSFRNLAIQNIRSYKTDHLISSLASLASSDNISLEGAKVKGGPVVARNLGDFITSNQNKSATLNSRLIYNDVIPALKSLGIKNVKGTLLPQSATPRDSSALSQILSSFPQLIRGRLAKSNTLKIGGKKINLKGGDDFDADLNSKSREVMTALKQSDDVSFVSRLNGGYVPNFGRIPIVSKMVGRVATNLMSPFGYGIYDQLKYIKKRGAKAAISSVLSDKPLHNFDKQEIWNQVNPEGRISYNPDYIDLESVAIREFAFRKMFGLSPRLKLTNSLLPLGKDNYSFLPNAGPAFKQLQEQSSEPRARAWGDNPQKVAEHAGSAAHIIMGGYKARMDKKSGLYSYEDRWDFGLHSGEKIPSIKDLYSEMKSAASGQYEDTSHKRGRRGGKTSGLTNILRLAMDKITSPITFKGSIDKWGDDVNYPQISSGYIPNYKRQKDSLYSQNLTSFTKSDKFLANLLGFDLLEPSTIERQTDTALGAPGTVSALKLRRANLSGRVIDVGGNIGQDDRKFTRAQITSNRPVNINKYRETQLTSGLAETVLATDLLKQYPDLKGSEKERILQAATLKFGEEGFITKAFKGDKNYQGKGIAYGSRLLETPMDKIQNLMVQRIIPEVYDNYNKKGKLPPEYRVDLMRTRFGAIPLGLPVYKGRRGIGAGVRHSFPDDRTIGPLSKGKRRGRIGESLKALIGGISTVSKIPLKDSLGGIFSTDVSATGDAFELNPASPESFGVYQNKKNIIAGFLTKLSSNQQIKSLTKEGAKIAKIKDRAKQEMAFSNYSKKLNKFNSYDEFGYNQVAKNLTKFGFGLQFGDKGGPTVRGKDALKALGRRGILSGGYIPNFAGNPLIGMLSSIPIVRDKRLKNLGGYYQGGDTKKRPSVRMSSNQAPPDYQGSLFHEYIHAALDQTGSLKTLNKLASKNPQIGKQSASFLKEHYGESVFKKYYQGRGFNTEETLVSILAESGGSQKEYEKIISKTPALRQPFNKIINRLGGFKSISQINKLAGIKSFNGGYIPNFANPLSSAISREMSAGIPVSQIRVENDNRLKSSFNPSGLAVTNTRDEPMGISQGISRALSEGINPKTYGVPNFVDSASVLRQKKINEQQEALDARKLGSIDLNRTEENILKRRAIVQEFAKGGRNVRYEDALKEYRQVEKQSKDPRNKASKELLTNLNKTIALEKSRFKLNIVNNNIVARQEKQIFDQQQKSTRFQLLQSKRQENNQRRNSQFASAIPNVESKFDNFFSLFGNIEKKVDKELTAQGIKNVGSIGGERGAARQNLINSLRDKRSSRIQGGAFAASFGLPFLASGLEAFAGNNAGTRIGSGAIQGLSTGALLGSSFGVPGILVAGGVGLAGGALGSVANEPKVRQEERLNKFVEKQKKQAEQFELTSAIGSQTAVIQDIRNSGGSSALIRKNQQDLDRLIKQIKDPKLVKTVQQLQSGSITGDQFQEKLGKEQSKREEGDIIEKFKEQRRTAAEALSLFFNTETFDGNNAANYNNLLTGTPNKIASLKSFGGEEAVKNTTQEISSVLSSKFNNEQISKIVGQTNSRSLIDTLLQEAEKSGVKGEKLQDLTEGLKKTSDQLAEAFAQFFREALPNSKALEESSKAAEEVQKSFTNLNRTLGQIALRANAVNSISDNKINLSDRKSIFSQRSNLELNRFGLSESQILDGETKIASIELNQRKNSDLTSLARQAQGGLSSLRSSDLGKDLSDELKKLILSAETESDPTKIIDNIKQIQEELSKTGENSNQELKAQLNNILIPLSANTEIISKNTEGQLKELEESNSQQKKLIELNRQINRFGGREGFLSGNRFDQGSFKKNLPGFFDAFSLKENSTGGLQSPDFNRNQGNVGKRAAILQNRERVIQGGRGAIGLIQQLADSGAIPDFNSFINDKKNVKIKNLGVQAGEQDILNVLRESGSNAIAQTGISQFAPALAEKIKKQLENLNTGTGFEDIIGSVKSFKASTPESKAAKNAAIELLEILNPLAINAKETSANQLSVLPSDKQLITLQEQANTKFDKMIDAAITIANNTSSLDGLKKRGDIDSQILNVDKDIGKTIAKRADIESQIAEKSKGIDKLGVVDRATRDKEISELQSQKQILLFEESVKKEERAFLQKQGAVLNSGSVNPSVSVGVPANKQNSETSQPLVSAADAIKNNTLAIGTGIESLNTNLQVLSNTIALLQSGGNSQGGVINISSNSSNNGEQINKILEFLKNLDYKVESIEKQGNFKIPPTKIP